MLAWCGGKIGSPIHPVGVGDELVPADRSITVAVQLREAQRLDPLTTQLATIQLVGPAFRVQRRVQELISAERTVAVTCQPRLSNSPTSANPRPREAPIISAFFIPHTTFTMSLNRCSVQNHIGSSSAQPIIADWTRTEQPRSSCQRERTVQSRRTNDHCRGCLRHPHSPCTAALEYGDD